MVRGAGVGVGRVGGQESVQSPNDSRLPGTDLGKYKFYLPKDNNLEVTLWEYWTGNVMQGRK